MPKRAPADPRALLRDRPHPLATSSTSPPRRMDVGALTPPLWGFEEREKLMVFYERASGSRMHANYFRFGGVHQDLPRRADRGHRRLLRHASPRCSTTSRACSTDNRIFKQRNVDIGVVSLEEASSWGFSGVMVRGSGARLGPAQGPALRVLFRARVRHPARQERRLLRPLSASAWRRCASPCRIMKQCCEKLLSAKAPARSDRRQEGGRRPARRDEALDGGADPPLQALHRGLPRAGRARSTPPSRRPRASSASIWWPTAATSPTAARSARRASRTCRPWTS